MAAAAKAYVIADDLTGAADTGLAFWKAGLSVVIVPDAAEATAADAEVVVLSTETRNLSSPKAAREAIRGMAERCLSHCADGSSLLLYKKIDSTLRGWVGAEISAL